MAHQLSDVQTRTRGDVDDQGQGEDLDQFGYGVAS